MRLPPGPDDRFPAFGRARARCVRGFVKTDAATSVQCVRIRFRLMGAGLAQQFVNSQSRPEASARRLRNAEASEFSAATIGALRSVLVGGPTSPRSGHGGANGYADASGSLCIVLHTGHGDVLGLTYRLAIFRNSNSASRAWGPRGAFTAVSSANVASCLPFADWCGRRAVCWRRRTLRWYGCRVRRRENCPGSPERTARKLVCGVKNAPTSVDYYSVGRAQTVPVGLGPQGEPEGVIVSPAVAAFVARACRSTIPAPPDLPCRSQ